MKVKTLRRINAANIKGYFQGNSRKIFNEWFNMSKDYIREQAMWRLERVKENSPKCLENDECIHCGCQVSGKVWEDRPCEGGCYPEMMNKEEWKKKESLTNETNNF